MSFHPARTASAAVLAMGAAVTAFGVSGPADQSRAPARYAVVVEQLIVPTVPQAINSRRTTTVLIAPGDTLESVLKAAGVADPEFLDFALSHEDTEDLRDLDTGRVMHLDIDSAGQVHQLRYSLGIDDAGLRTGLARRLVIHRSPTGLVAGLTSIELSRSTQIGEATIQTNLFAATAQADIPYPVANQVADVFGNEIRFDRDLRPGDRLKVIYEVLREPDSFEAPESGRLLAVELINKGRVHNAVWVPSDDDTGAYYDFDGNNAASAFLRYPIEFARISSGFQQARLHPVLGRRQAHNGTDFAARPGTKIRATGAGVVESIGDQRGYGRTVVIRHGQTYSTLYAHMQGYRKGLRVGAPVKQGEVIGYVGSSGTATGPHCHYEFRINDRVRNPLTVNLPQASPLAEPLRERHARRVYELQSQFAQLDQVKLAANFR